MAPESRGDAVAVISDYREEMKNELKSEFV